MRIVECGRHNSGDWHSAIRIPQSAIDMTLRISNLRLGLDEPEATLADRVGAILGARPERWRILRKSFDARVKDDLHFVYAVEVSLPAEESRAAVLARVRPPVRIEQWAEPPFQIPPAGNEPLPHPPIVIGSG